MRLALFLLASSIAAIAQTKPFSWSLAENADSGLVLTVTNSGGLPISGMCFRTNVYIDGKQKGASFLYFDSLVNVSKDKPILPNDSRVYNVVAGVGAAQKSVQYRADENGPGVLFADGTSFGDTTLVAVLRGRRLVVLNDLKRYIPPLDLLASSSNTPDALLRELTADIANHRASKSASIVDQPGARVESDVSLARGFIAQLLKLSIDSIEEKACSSVNGDCARRHYATLKARCEKWRDQLNSASTIAQR